eukprot:351223-Chlamydomonas_euryale.AAC.3
MAHGCRMRRACGRMRHACGRMQPALGRMHAVRMCRTLNVHMACTRNGMHAQQPECPTARMPNGSHAHKHACPTARVPNGTHAQ